MPRVGRLLSPVLIGRDELLDLAERRLEESAMGRRQFLLLAGEAGIGKSRLIAAVETKARAAGFQTAAGLLAPQDRDVPAGALLDMARSMTRLEPWSALGRRLLSLVDETIAAPQPARRVLVLRAVDLVVDALDRPTVLAFDDLQWADDLSLEIIAELARGTADRPLLIVGAYRTEELVRKALLKEWRARLLTQRIAEEARLTPLSLEQTAFMTTLILGTGLPAPRDVVAAVFERSDGVPLHVEELLGAVSDDERSDGRAIRQARVPDTLEDAILRRVGRLSPAAQTVARCGAVIGRCFVPEVLAGIMEVPVESLEAPLQELIDEHVLDPPGPRGLYDFRHQLLRDALYGSLTERQKRRFHARAGEFAKELEGASESHASFHFERAGLKAQAFRSALQGALVAARLSSHPEAFELYRRAVDNMPAGLPALEQAQILEAFGVEAAAIEELEVWEWTAREARDRYQRAGDPIGAAAQLAALAGVARRRAEPLDDRLDVVRSGLGELEGLPTDPRIDRARAKLLIEEAYTSIDALDLARGHSSVAAARAAARSGDDEEDLFWATSLEGALEVVNADPAVGLERIASVAREARERGFEDAAVTAYRDAAVLAARIMEYERSARLISEGVRYADAIQQSHCAHVMAATGALVAWASGCWDEAVERGGRALVDRGCPRGAGMARWAIGYTALGRGEEEVAREQLVAAETFGLTSGAPDLILAATWGLAELSLLTGDVDEASARSQHALETAERFGERGRLVPFVVTGVRAWIAGGRPADAERWLADVGKVLGPAQDLASPALDHAAGLLSLHDGSLGLARKSLERAVRGWEARPRVWEALWARLDLAGCLMRSSRHVEAASHIADVRNAAQELRSRPLLERAGELGRLARGRDAEAGAWHPLTAREFEVARLVATGLTNRQIADELHVSPRTASAHVEHILAKLGATRRAEIASWVARTARRVPARDPSAPGTRDRPSAPLRAVDR
ncbi:MAG TPA: AAA family ATPase [Candidatus Limnocylindrales bacterium]|nr:AAA family ATPase [Candidatus Limnocylindrales bacterium]